MATDCIWQKIGLKRKMKKQLEWTYQNKCLAEAVETKIQTFQMNFKGNFSDSPKMFLADLSQPYSDRFP